MLLDAQRILVALTREFARLQSRLADKDVEASAGFAMANALQLLGNRERGDAAAVKAQFAALSRLLTDIGSPLEAAGGVLRQSFTELQQHAVRSGALDNLRSLEAAWREGLARFQALLAQPALAALDSAVKLRIGQAVTAWEIADLQRQSAASSQTASGDNAVDIDRDNLTAYLRDRFREPALQVTECTPLAGGFGKQTVLFAVSGTALNGEFVMRRDLGARPTVANDCHLVRQEYPVIRAAHARGFPAPDALWVDTEHQLLPGGDFLIMRRAPGKLAGSFFGASAPVPASLADSLAEIAARLHSLPPLHELGDLTDSIAKPLWDLPRQACVERYIRNWFELFLREEHTPSPALMALYRWLFDHVPNRPGKSVLLHGDIGFNNFLFDGDRLSAVLDWEFAHIGDPAEELGYIKVTTGASLDWARFMARYQAAGGEPVDAETLRYFQVWAFVRNCTAANLLTTLFANGHTDDIKVPILPAMHIPNFIRGAQAVIESGSG